LPQHTKLQICRWLRPKGRSFAHGDGTVTLAAILAISIALPTAGLADTLTDAQVRQQMITESIAAYPGHCPCPYNLASNGSHCGKRSAWSKAGGYAPLCYGQDISDKMVNAYRIQKGLHQ
jgi:hypothetical protein